MHNNYKNIISLKEYSITMKTNNQEAIKISNDQFPIHIDNTAINMAKQILNDLDDDNNILRISIKGGGCSGLKYSLNFIQQTDECDLITNIQGLNVVIDIFSINYLKNANITYIETLNGNGFKFNNPNAQTTCACGSSFK